MNTVPCNNPAHGVQHHVAGSRAAMECGGKGPSGASASNIPPVTPSHSLSAVDILEQQDSSPTPISDDWLLHPGLDGATLEVYRDNILVSYGYDTELESIEIKPGSDGYPEWVRLDFNEWSGRPSVTLDRDQLYDDDGVAKVRMEEDAQIVGLELPPSNRNRLEYVDDYSNKFYETQITEDDEGHSVVFRWGRIGSGGQEKVAATGVTVEEAREIADRQLESKRNRGYDDAELQAPYRSGKA